MRFPSTDWSLVALSRAPAPSPADAAMAELCRRYWSPLYRYLRRRGFRPEEAEDLTQGFLTHAIGTRLFKRAASERGRLRTLLLTCLANFVANEQGRVRALKRGGISWPDTRSTIDPQLDFEPADDMTPERVYEVHWALGLLRNVLNELRLELRSRGKELLFDRLKHLIVGERPPDGYREVARQLNLSETAARVAVHRLRRRFREKLHAEVARTLGGPDPDVQGELDYLLKVLQHPSRLELEV